MKHKTLAHMLLGTAALCGGPSVYCAYSAITTELTWQSYKDHYTHDQEDEFSQWYTIRSSESNLSKVLEHEHLESKELSVGREQITYGSGALFFFALSSGLGLAAFGQYQKDSSIKLKNQN